MQCTTMLSDRDLEGWQLPAGLRNLSLNKNRLTSRSRVLANIAQAAHALHYISLLGEPARGSS